jgi:hypothetical protein
LPRTGEDSSVCTERPWAVRGLWRVSSASKGRSTLSSRPTGRQTGGSLYQEWTQAHPTWNVWALPLFGDAKPVAILQGERGVYAARLSPDGKWIAYASFETGPPEVYIERFMEPGEKKQISRGGGSHPRWTRDGRELVYWADPGQGGASAVDLEFTSTGFRASIPRTLISVPILNLIDGRPHYDVTRDGQRFLLRQPARPQQPAITMIINWTEKLKK